MHSWHQRPQGEADKRGWGGLWRLSLKTQKLHSHQLDILFKMQCRPQARERKNTMAFEGAWKIHYNYWVGEKAVRLKDEGPALSLQRNPRLPWADFQSYCREKSQQSVITKAPHQQLNYNGLLNFKVYSVCLTFVLNSNNVIIIGVLCLK